jgi:hypothetical protein
MPVKNKKRREKTSINFWYDFDLTRETEAKSTEVFVNSDRGLAPARCSDILSKSS